MSPQIPSRVAELRAFEAAHPGCSDCDVLWTNLSGTLRGKRLRWHEVESVFTAGRPFPGSMLVADVIGEDCDVGGFLWAGGDADKYGQPIRGTLKLAPGAPRYAQVQVAMHERDSRPVMLDPRNVLDSVVARFAELRLTPVVACEIEFYLLDAEAAAAGRAEPPRALASARRFQHQTYLVRDLQDMRPFFDDMYATCAAQDLPLGCGLSEFGPGQFELTLLHHADAGRAVDEAIQFKHTVKTVALRHAMEATFMAKPYDGQPGNGMHLHVSLLDSDGVNIFGDESEQGSPRLRHAIGGMARLMPESFAIFAPNANSYRRFRANSFAPTTPRWGVDNRTVSMRVTTGAPATRHIEHRVSGSDANPYLAVAAMLAGAHYGLVNEIDAGPPVVGDGYLAPAPSDAPRLPRHWYEAVDWMAEGKVLHTYLGRQFVDNYVAVKQHEQDRFYGANTVRDYDWYLRNA